MSLSEADHISIIGAWVGREAALEAQLCAGVDGTFDESSPLARALDLAPKLPRGGIFSTVFFRLVGELGTNPHYQVGIRMRSTTEVSDPPVDVIFGTMPSLEPGAEVEPSEDVDPLHAVTIGSLAIAKQRWATVRGLELGEDGTCLLLGPPEPLAAAA